MLFTGGRIDADRAARIGLINDVVADEALDQVVLDIAGQIAVNAPLSIASMKFTITEAMKPARDADMAAIQASIAGCFNSADYKEGRAAFMEKRAPVFRGG